MRISLIVTTYNRADALFLVLESIKNQSLEPFEVIIADDGSNNLTKIIIDKFTETSNLNVIHSFQEDLGFRVAESRNKAIAKASGDYIILIDGDMLLHPKFINDHATNATKGYYIQGSRVLLSPIKTEKVLNSKDTSLNILDKGLNNKLNGIHSVFLTKFFSTKSSFLKGVKSCNMSFYRKDCIKVNGFNGSFIGWGREDSEFVIRLFNNGVKRKNLKFSAIQYHLWHDESNRGSLTVNDELLNKTISQNLNWCEIGIDKFL